MKYLVFRIERKHDEDIEPCCELLAEFTIHPIDWKDKIEYQKAVDFASAYTQEHGLRTIILTARVFEPD